MKGWISVRNGRGHKRKGKKLLLRSQRLDAARDVAWPSRDKSPGEKWPRPTRAIKSQSRNDPPVMALRHVTSSDNGPDHERERARRPRQGQCVIFQKRCFLTHREWKNENEIQKRAALGAKGKKKSSTWGKRGKKEQHLGQKGKKNKKNS